jgi:hypothetical protein
MQRSCWCRCLRFCKGEYAGPGGGVDGGRVRAGTSPDTHRDGDAGRTADDHRRALRLDGTRGAARSGPLNALPLVLGSAPRRLVIQLVLITHAAPGSDGAPRTISASNATTPSGFTRSSVHPPAGAANGPASDHMGLPAGPLIGSSRTRRRERRRRTQTTRSR